MTVRRVGVVAVASAALILAACSVTPAPTPDPTDTGPRTCDPEVFLRTTDADVSLAAVGLTEFPYPLDGIEDLGSFCTMQLTVHYADPVGFAEFDMLLTNTQLKDVESALTDATEPEGWVCDETAPSYAPIWRDPADPDHYVQAWEIEEGVLVGVTAVD